MRPERWIETRCSGDPMALAPFRVGDFMGRAWRRLPWSISTACRQRLLLLRCPVMTRECVPPAVSTPPGGVVPTHREGQQIAPASPSTLRGSPPGGAMAKCGASSAPSLLRPEPLATSEFLAILWISLRSLDLQSSLPSLMPVDGLYRDLPGLHLQ